jgi:hypothetical protein
MGENAGILIELILVFGGVLAWSIYQLRALRRSDSQDEAEDE